MEYFSGLALKLDLLISASQVVGIIGMSHCAWSSISFFKGSVCKYGHSKGAKG
jgi:hypothetical protein